jgi:hypothetical protein
MDDQPDRTRAASERARYDRDLYTWAAEQAALLRAGRIAEADVLNIAEEIDDVGNEQYHRLESALRLILLHLLKWDHQPQRPSRSWWSTIRVQRNRVERLLQDSPGLKSRRELAVGRAYEDARVEASAQTRLALKTFPAICPFSWKDIIHRPIDWPAD